MTVEETVEHVLFDFSAFSQIREFMFGAYWPTLADLSNVVTFFNMAILTTTRGCDRLSSSGRLHNGSNEVYVPVELTHHIPSCQNPILVCYSRKKKLRNGW